MRNTRLRLLIVTATVALVAAPAAISSEEITVNATGV